MSRDILAVITSTGHGHLVSQQDNMRNMKKIILASASPRRKEILKKTGLKFSVDESTYEENNGIGLKPPQLALYHARSKAREVAARHKNALVISADTIVVLKNVIFGKPEDKADAARILKALSGRTHAVITAFTILDTASKKELSKAVESMVTFRRLEDSEISAYIKSGEPMDKAGAYGVQGLGAAIVKKIEGDFFNVMGLPLSELAEQLRKFGIKIL
jgi:septum formation protein